MKHPMTQNALFLLAILFSLWSVACSSIAATTPTQTPIPPHTPTLISPTIAPTLTTVSSSPVPSNLNFEQAVHLFDYDPYIPFDVKEISTQVKDGVSVRSITYAAHDSSFGVNGRTLAYLVAPVGKVFLAGILFMHWLGQPNGNRDEFLEEAIALAQKGTVSLLIQGTFPWTEAPSIPQHDQAQVIHQVIELRRALDLLVGQPGVDPKRIGYVGHDYGAMYGGILSGIEKRVKTFVLMAGIGNFGDWSLKYFPGSRTQDPDMYRQTLKVVDPIAYVGHAVPASLFFQFARTDQFISDQAAQQFYDAASEPKQIQSYSTAHSLIGDDVRRDRDDWLTTQLNLKDVR